MVALPDHAHALHLATSIQHSNFERSNFRSFLFLHTASTYEIYEDLHYTKISRYAVPSLLSRMLIFMLDIDDGVIDYPSPLQYLKTWELNHYCFML